MDQKELYPGIRFSTWDSEQLPAFPFKVHLPPRPETGALWRQPFPYHLPPPTSLWIPPTTSSLPFWHIFKLCPASGGAISLSVAFTDSFQNAGDLLPLNPAPIQPVESSHLPPSKNFSGLGDSESPGLQLRVTGFLCFTP